MTLPAGKTIPLTPLRRLMCDFLDASRRVPLVAIERRLDLREVIEARRGAGPRPSWFAIFLKAYALVAARRDDLRQSYLSFPCARLHQHACNVASLAVARRVGDEDGVLALKLREPESFALCEIDRQIRRARTEPVESIGSFRRQFRVARLPRPVRRLLWWATLDVSGGWRAQHLGTFGVTGVGALGSASLHLLSPLTTTLTYGVFNDDGTVMARLFYDHRVLDGVGPSEALRELEEELRGPITGELRGAARRAA